MDENEIIPYIERVFRFCCKRLSQRYDAEDLASEIICHVLEGMKRYKIESLDAWVWQVAHNRYAKFLDRQNRLQVIPTEDEVLCNVADGQCWWMDGEAEEKMEEEKRKYESVFRYLHTLSAGYRNIFIDYYIGGLSVRMLSKKYALPETTVKWRLNAGRRKIRERIGEKNMDKVYKRINWNTACCNGFIKSNHYLDTQIARAICQAAYQKPLTVEEISIRTGIPALYIEDELPRLEYGDAVCKTGSKYAANFIIFSLQDRKDIETDFGPLVKEISDKLEALLRDGAERIKDIGFYGHDFGMERLGYILVPYLLRRKIKELKNGRLNLENGSYPPRKDGGYGWFIVEETADEEENSAEYDSGCNVAGDDSGSRNEIMSCTYYYWTAKYFDVELYHNRGTRWMHANGIPQNSRDGMVKKEALSEEDAAALIRNHLLEKAGEDYKLQFACFTESQFAAFVSRFEMDESLDDLLVEWIGAVRAYLGKAVPGRLESQINQWVSHYLFQIVGYGTDELIRRGVLRKPELDKPLTEGVFYVEGKYIDL